MEQEGFPYCTIVAVTAYVSSEAVQKCYDSGMDEVGKILFLIFLQLTNLLQVKF